VSNAVAYRVVFAIDHDRPNDDARQTMVSHVRLRGPSAREGQRHFARSMLMDGHKLRQHDNAGQLWCQQNFPGGYMSYGTMRNLSRTFSMFKDL